MNIYLTKPDLPQVNHFWIFSKNVHSIDRGVKDGDIVDVFGSDRNFLGHAFVNTKSSIVARMINFDHEDPLETIKDKLQAALTYRSLLFDPNKTNAYRLFNSEGDGLSGLTIDRYNDVLVIQISSLGIERVKDFIVQSLVELIKPKTIYEKSTMPSRRAEDMESSEGYLYGEKVEVVDILENNVAFRINLITSHKTGFYLDQREMRQMVGTLAKNRKILNCFSYTGGFSLYAALNGAREVTSIDISKEVINQAEENFSLNGLDPKEYNFVSKDVFKYLEEENALNFDFVILDPPAFAKKKADVENAIRGYRNLNWHTMEKMPHNSFLLTCSCSYHVDAEMFDKIIYQAALKSGKLVKVIQRHRHALDHAINLFHPENDYLKSLLLYIE